LPIHSAVASVELFQEANIRDVMIFDFSKTNTETVWMRYRTGTPVPNTVFAGSRYHRIGRVTQRYRPKKYELTKCAVQRRTGIPIWISPHLPGN